MQKCTRHTHQTSAVVNVEYLKAKIDELQSNNKITNIRHRGTSDFKKAYQFTTNRINDEKDDLVTDFLNSMAKWWNHFSQLFECTKN